MKKQPNTTIIICSAKIIKPANKRQDLFACSQEQSFDDSINRMLECGSLSNIFMTGALMALVLDLPIVRRLGEVENESKR